MRPSIILAACLPLLVAADLPALPANIEIDLIFPRNETYSAADNFPIVLAMQNAALAYSFGFTLSWRLYNLSEPSSSESSSSPYSYVDSDSITMGSPLTFAAPPDTFFIANSTYKFGHASYKATTAGIYQLSWTFALTENCTEDGEWVNHTIGASHGHGVQIFTIADEGKAVDLLDGGSCPELGVAVGIQSNISGCAHVDNSGIQASPCNIEINESLASSLSAELPPATTYTSTKKTTAGTTATASGSKTATGTGTSSPTTTTATGNHAATRGALQTAAAVVAGAAGLCAMLV